MKEQERYALLPLINLIVASTVSVGSEVAVVCHVHATVNQATPVGMGVAGNA